MLAPAFADALDDARAAGQIGERPDGLVGAVNAGAPANINSLVQATNAKRLQKYQQIGAEKGVPAEQVGAIAGEKIIGNLKSGWYYMDASGNWVTEVGVSRMADLPRGIDETVSLLRQGNYVADRSLGTAVFLSLKLKRPLFLEGEAGVGKTEIAKVLAATLGRKLVRLQCYEGLDVGSAVYEWDYPRQMLEIRLAEAAKFESKAPASPPTFSPSGS